MRVYRRWLPHWDAPGAAVFVTWRLAGSLPAGRMFPGGALRSGRAFVAMDRLLDAGQCGARWLGRADLAAVVQDSLLGAERAGACVLHAYVIMPNHVHVLWTTRGSLAELVGRVKGGTAFAINRILGRTGGPLWQSEYYDRMVRDGVEFRRIQGYVEWNPVTAGLVGSPEEFRWSSGFRGAARE